MNIPTNNNIPILNKNNKQPKELKEQKLGCYPKPVAYCYIPEPDIHERTHEILQKIFSGNSCPLCRS